jgi:hypothetical protein
MISTARSNYPEILRILHRCFLPSLAPFGQAVSKEKIFLTLANQKQELLLVAIFVGGMGPYRGSYIDAFCQVVSTVGLGIVK